MKYLIKILSFFPGCLFIFYFDYILYLRHKENIDDWECILHLFKKILKLNYKVEKQFAP